MGKASKAHRAKVEKRNQKITVEKYAMKKAIERMFEAQKMMSETEKLNVELNGQDLNFEVVEDLKNSVIIDEKNINIEK
jgi:hypothetical protein|tara:strand:+ start:1909 stop:2145 length:237 start_codon:yes stop_codon:yes gene_type:complete